MRLVGLLVALVAGCAPTVDEGIVLAVDDMGEPISTYRVALTPVGRVELVPINLRNEGASMSAPVVLSMSGTAAAEFTIQPGLCVGASLEPGRTCSTFLEFRAAVVGMRDARLTITTDTSALLDLQTDVFMGTAR